MSNPNGDTTYHVTLCTFTRWATGNVRGTRDRTITVTEEATILGGCRAIDAAIAIVGEGNVALELMAPRITPNPALEGWPMGTVAS